MSLLTSRLSELLRSVQATTGSSRIVYTVNTGGYDLFIDLPDGLVEACAGNIDFVYIKTVPVAGCDDHSRRQSGAPAAPGPSLSPGDANTNWRVIEMEHTKEEEENEQTEPFLVSRDIKVRAHLFCDSYESSLYVDSNVRLNVDPSPLWDEALSASSSPMAVFEHPVRSSLRQEFDEVRRLATLNPWERKIVHHDLFERQYAKYRDTGAFDACEARFRLTWNNVIFRRHRDARVRAAMDTWFEELRTFRQRDQLSFLYALWKHDLADFNTLSLNDDRYIHTVRAENKDGAYPYFTRLNHYFTRPFGGAHVNTRDRVLVVKQFPQLGSNLLRGQQVADELNRLGMNVSVVEAQQGKGRFLEPFEDPRLSALASPPDVDTVLLFVGKLHVPYARLATKPSADAHAHAHANPTVTVVLDIVDKLCEIHDRPDKILEVLAYVDVLVCPNKSVAKFFDRAAAAERDRRPSSSVRLRRTCVIHHHWDPRYSKVEAAVVAKTEEEGGGGVVFGYMGSVSTASRNMIHMERLVREQGMRVIDTESGADVTADVAEGRPNLASNHSASNVQSMMSMIDAMTTMTMTPMPMGSSRARGARARDAVVNCHVSIRQKGSAEWKYKTDTKLSTAACLGCPIVTTREDGVTEVLPASYPYLVDSDRFEDVSAMMDYVRDTYGKEPWHRALRVMRDLKKARCIRECIKDYVQLFHEISVARHALASDRLK